MGDSSKYYEYLEENIRRLVQNTGCPPIFMKAELISDSAQEEKLKTVIRELTNERNYLNFYAMTMLRCLFDLMISGAPGDRKPNPELYKLIRFGSTIQRSNDINHPALYKIMLNDGSKPGNLITLKTSSNPQAVLLEYFVGAYGVNNLRLLIPNFTMVLSVFTCKFDHNLAISPQSIRGLCTVQSGKIRKPDVLSNYIIYEYTEDHHSFYDYLTSSDVAELDFFVNNLLPQLCLALQTAYDEIRFVHNNCTPENIRIKKFETARDVYYKFGYNNYIFHTDSIPIIHDYGYSSFMYEGVVYKNRTYHQRLYSRGIEVAVPPGYGRGIEVGAVVEMSGISPNFESFSGVDIYRMVMGLLHMTVTWIPEDQSEKMYDRFKWLFGFYRNSDPYNLIRATYEETVKAVEQHRKNFIRPFVLDEGNPAHLPALQKTPLGLYNYIVTVKLGFGKSPRNEMNVPSSNLANALLSYLDYSTLLDGQTFEVALGKSLRLCEEINTLSFLAYCIQNIYTVRNEVVREMEKFPLFNMGSLKLLDIVIDTLAQKLTDTELIKNDIELVSGLNELLESKEYEEKMFLFESLIKITAVSGEDYKKSVLTDIDGKLSGFSIGGGLITAFNFNSFYRTVVQYTGYLTAIHSEFCTGCDLGLLTTLKEKANTLSRSKRRLEETKRVFDQFYALSSSLFSSMISDRLTNPNRPIPEKIYKTMNLIISGNEREKCSLCTTSTSWGERK